MKIRLFAFTQTGARLCARLTKVLQENGLQATGYAKDGLAGLTVRTGTLKQNAEQAFLQKEALIFVGAVGIAVRTIAPFVRSKTTDPPVLALDEKGQYVIPLLSGHLGGANALAKLVAEKIGAIPVITTATDLQGAFAVDVWAKAQGCTLLNSRGIQWVSAAVLAGQPVGLASDFPLEGELPFPLSCQTAGEVGISLSLHGGKTPFAHTLHVVPPCVVLGVGCRKNVAPAVFEKAVFAVLAAQGIPFSAVTEIASINLKEKEEAILAFCQQYDLPFSVYPAEELAAVAGSFTSPAFVHNTVGVGHVCERSAVKRAQGPFLFAKQAQDGATAAAAPCPWHAPFSF